MTMNIRSKSDRTGFKKMILIDPRHVRITAANDPESRMVVQDILHQQRHHSGGDESDRKESRAHAMQSRIETLDAEMEQILTDKNLNDEDKLRRYLETLRKHIMSVKQFDAIVQEPVPVRIVNRHWDDNDEKLKGVDDSDDDEDYGEESIDTSSKRKLSPSATMKSPKKTKIGKTIRAASLPTQTNLETLVKAPVVDQQALPVIQSKPSTSSVPDSSSILKPTKLQIPLVSTIEQQQLTDIKDAPRKAVRTDYGTRIVKWAEAPRLPTYGIIDILDSFPVKKRTEAKNILQYLESRALAGDKFLNWNKRTGELLIDDKQIPGSNILESMHIFFGNNARPKNYIPEGHLEFDKLIRKKESLIPSEHSNPEWLRY